eukprot:g70291.t1
MQGELGFCCKYINLLNMSEGPGRGVGGRVLSLGRLHDHRYLIYSPDYEETCKAIVWSERQSSVVCVVCWTPLQQCVQSCCRRVWYKLQQKFRLPSELIHLLLLMLHSPDVELQVGVQVS